MKLHRAWHRVGHASGLARSFFVLSFGAAVWLQAPSALAVPPPAGQTSPPAIRSASASLVTPSAALPTYTLTSPGLTEPVNPILVSLAKRLDNNPDRIFEYVYNEIEFVPLFGVTKGALGAHLNKAGTAFDQAELMQELLRAANVPVRLRFGEVTLSAADAASLFGTSNSVAVSNILADGGIPATVSGAPTVTSAAILHVWVEAQIGGVWYAFDPALKTHNVFAGDNLMTASGVTSAGLTSAAFSSGSTASTVSGVPRITGANKTNLRTYLAARATAFESAMSSSVKLSTASLEILGGVEIKAKFRTTDRFTTNPRQTQSHAVWTGAIPNSFRVQISITSCDSITYFADEQFKAQFTAGYHDALSSNPIHPAWSDTAAYNRFLQMKSSVPVSILPCAVAPQTKKPFEVAIDHPYAASSGNYADARYLIDSALANRGPGLAYTVQYAASQIIRIDVGVSTSGVSELIRERFKDTGTYLTVPMAPPIAGSSLVDVAEIEEFFARQTALRALVGRVLKQRVVQHHSAAFLGNNFVVFDWTTQQWTAPYKQFYTFEGGELRLVTVSSLVSVNDLSGNATNEVAATKTLGAISASFESLSGLAFVNRISPADLFDTHLDVGRSQRFFTVTNANYTAAMSQTTGYSNADKALIQTFVQSGLSAVIPNQPVQARMLYNWSGTTASPAGGSLGPATTYQAIIGSASTGTFVALLADEVNGERYVIKGGAGNVAGEGSDQIGMRKEFADALNGGLFNTDSILSVDPESGKAVLAVPPLISTGGKGAAQSLDYQVKLTDVRATSSEIAEGANYQGSGQAGGAITLADQQFLAIGASTPTTRISSNARAGLQLGFDIGLQTGDRAPRDAAALIVLIQSINALNVDSGVNEGRRAIAGAVATTWALDQMADSVATINLGLGGVEQFVRNPAGVYLSGPQSIATLTRTGTPTIVPPHNKRGYRDVVFTYDNKDGVSAKFQVITPKQTLGNETLTEAQIVTCMGFAGASATQLLPLERVFWGIEREFSIIESRTNPGAITTFDYEAKVGCNDPGLKRVRNNFGRQIGLVTASTKVENDASDTAEMVGAAFAGNGFIGGCVGGTTGNPVFKTGAQVAAGQSCGAPTEKVSYAAQNDIPVILASASECFVEGEYDGRMTKTHCRKQRYFLGNDPTPFAVLEIDAYGGGVLSKTDAFGKITKYTVVPGYRSSVTDAANFAVEQYFDQRGRLASSLDKRNRYAEYTYDSAGRVIEERARYLSDPANTWHTRTTYTYDAVGNRLTETVRPRTTSAGVEFSGAPLTTKYRYDDPVWKRKMTKSTDPENFSVTMAYDTNGQMIRQIGPFKDATPDVTTDDPVCTSAGVPCKEYSYAGPFGLVSEERVRTQSGQWRRTSYAYDTPANKYVLKTVTQHPEGP